jgi:hypothetical protein
MYTSGNPINFTDPSGMLKENEETDANNIVQELKSKYNVVIIKDWGYISYPLDFTQLPPMQFTTCWKSGKWRNLGELQLVKETVIDVSNTLGGPLKFQNAFHNRPVRITRKIDFPGAGLALPIIQIWLENSTFYSDTIRGKAFSKYTVAHELGHVWDIRENMELTKGLGLAVGTIQQRCVYLADPYTCWTDFYYSPSNYLEEAPGDPDRLGNGLELDKYAYSTMYEDWAESFASYVYKKYWTTHRFGDDLIQNGIRWTYVETQIQNIP